MPRNPKLFLQGGVYFITTRIASGLPLVAAGLVKEIVKSILARAARLYPVKISDLLVMGNHIHFIAVVENAQTIDRFMRYFKTESAQAINRLLGRAKGVVWEEGYDSPIILDLAALIQKLVYIYTNPQRANLVDNIDEYPNLSTWALFRVGRRSSWSCLLINRLAVRRVPNKLTPKQDAIAKMQLIQEATGRLQLFFEPDAAFDALKEDGVSFLDFQEEVVKLVRQQEAELRSERSKTGKRPLGAELLKNQSLVREHVPSKLGRRMLCIASIPALRKLYVGCFRKWVGACKLVHQAWKVVTFLYVTHLGSFLRLRGLMMLCHQRSSGRKKEKPIICRWVYSGNCFLSELA
jgi:REP element-mobilizing transposase RayT